MTACFRAPLDRYDGVRRLRVESLVKVVEPVWGVEVGDNRFLDLLKTESFDLFCHHAAEVANYRSWEFDALGATAKNTRAARRILTSLAGKDCQRMIMTGSVFEPFEGEGDPERRALNPYGLSKHLSFEVYRLETQRVDVALDKFVIPNPFGPLEEPRFTTYLAKEWEAREYGARAGREVFVELVEQTDFTEPLVRINGRPAQDDHPEWNPTPLLECGVRILEQSKLNDAL